MDGPVSSAQLVVTTLAGDDSDHHSRWIRDRHHHWLIRLATPHQVMADVSGWRYTSRPPECCEFASDTAHFVMIAMLRYGHCFARTPESRGALILLMMPIDPEHVAKPSTNSTLFDRLWRLSTSVPVDRQHQFSWWEAERLYRQTGSIHWMESSCGHS